jgi:putative endonuclease
VYILESASTGKRYIGQTDDLERRLAEHNSREHNLCKFTSRHPGPWRLVYHETCETRSEAMRRERWLKSGVGRQWIADHLGRASPAPPQADLRSSTTAADQPPGCSPRANRALLGKAMSIQGNLSWVELMETHGQATNWVYSYLVFIKKLRRFRHPLGCSPVCKRDVAVQDQPARLLALAQNTAGDFRTLSGTG